MQQNTNGTKYKQNKMQKFQNTNTTKHKRTKYKLPKYKCNIKQMRAVLYLSVSHQCVHYYVRLRAPPLCMHYCNVTSLKWLGYICILFFCILSCLYFGVFCICILWHFFVTFVFWQCVFFPFLCCCVCILEFLHFVMLYFVSFGCILFCLYYGTFVF